jgi:hypothetical protein
VTGTVIDAETSALLADVIVRVEGTALSAVTDALGVFTLAGVPAGVRTLVLTHLGYGERTGAVTVVAGGAVTVRIRLSRRVVELAPVVVEVLTETGQRRVTSGHAINEIERSEIEAAARIGLDLGELLRQGMPGVRVRERDALGAGYCVEYRGGVGSGRSCRDVTVYMDGVRISTPAFLYQSLRLDDVERLELLSPGEAGTRYGGAAAFGILIVETRQGPRPAARAVVPAAGSGSDWSLERQSYPYLRVLGSAILANAVGLGLGIVVADRCLRISDSGLPALRTKCGAMTTMGSGFLSLGLPSFSGSVAARWAGSTERSRGRALPAALLGTLTVAAGYLLIVQGESEGSQLTPAVGGVILTVGTPLVLTGADRLLRTLR